MTRLTTERRRRDRRAVGQHRRLNANGTLALIDPGSAHVLGRAIVAPFFTQIEEMFERGITTGCFSDPSTGERRFRPADNVTREAMATFGSARFP